MLETLGSILMGVGGIIAAIGNIWLLVKAVREGCGWGLLVLLVPFGNIVFIVKFWDEAKKPFSTALLGFSFQILGFVVSGASVFDTIMANRPGGGPPPVTQQQLNARVGEVVKASQELKASEVVRKTSPASSGQAGAAKPAATASRPTPASRPTAPASAAKPAPAVEGPVEASGSGDDEWAEARNQLVVSASMKRGGSAMAIVNGEKLEVGQTITIRLRGREFVFRVKRIGAEKDVEFEPATPKQP